ncbi:hypothetical protein SAMD00024442_7_58 [Candidatus Symbiothrix dinenymphae]|nr:hypothetical protein SAMD00024442_7_58 [Candidatus Symbiothrix dinenymphae]
MAKLKVIIDTNLWVSFVMYLLSLADTISANYIITGDKDLLVLKHHNQTPIITYTEFMTILGTICEA